MRSIKKFATAVVAVAACALPGSALAAPTGSQITTPAAPTFTQYDHNDPSTVHVAGTTSGGTGDVDLRCYVGSKSGLLKAAVPVVAGSFSTDVDLSAGQLATTQGERYCVVRAVPTGTTPAAAPGTSSPWQGPEVGWGQGWNYQLGLAGAPNPPATLEDYWISAPQAGAYDDYDSVSSCGLCDVWVHAAGTYARSNAIWWANDALYNHVPGTDPYTRSALQVDGVDAYSGHGASSEGLQASANFPGLSYDQEVDPVSGDLTIHEMSPFATCSPQPAVYPPTKTSCASFSKVVVLNRTIVQNHAGRQVTIRDEWSSADGQPHAIDAYYDETAEDVNNALAGHETTLDFGWTGDGPTSYAAGTQIPTAGAAGRSVVVKPDGAVSDAGDGMNPIGAITYGREPSEMIIRSQVSSTNEVANWQERYKLTVPATGVETLVHVYSHALSLAELQLLIDDARATVGAPAAPVEAPAPTAPADAGTAPSSQPVAVPARVVKCRVPKLKGKTLRRAKSQLRHAHCRLGKVTRKQSARVHAGRVIRSKPGAGRVRKAGTRIALTLATR